MVCSSWVLWAPRSDVKLWKAAAWTSPSLQNLARHTLRIRHLLTLVRLPQVLSIVAVFQMNKVRSRALKNSDSCQTEELNRVAMVHNQMDIVAQWAILWCVSPVHGSCLDTLAEKTIPRQRLQVAGTRLGPQAEQEA